MSSRLLLLPALAVVAIALAGSPGCKKSTAPTYGGTLGATSGPSFNFTFPATGTSQTFTFADTGSWGYHCTPHQNMGMTGTVVVTATATTDSALVIVGVPANSFSPASVSIRPNGYVRWVNGSAVTIHTVTRP
jgi:plastocyanin